MSLRNERPSSTDAVERWLNLPMGCKRNKNITNTTTTTTTTTNNTANNDNNNTSLPLANEMDLMSNMQTMLEHLRAHLSKDGHSQLKRLIGNMDRPSTSKRMKPISLSELNTADLCFIIVAMFERRLSVVSLENEQLKVALERANNRITKLEHETRFLRNSRQSTIEHATTSNTTDKH